MTSKRHDDNREQIIHDLSSRAVSLWGEQRAVDLKPSIEQMADWLMQIAQDLPGQQEEPAFFLR